MTTHQRARPRPRRIGRADRLQIAHHRRRLGIGQRDEFHMHHRIRETGVHEHIADIVHVGEAADMGVAVDSGKGGAQLLERVGTERRERDEASDAQHAADLGQARWQVAGPLQCQVAPDEVERARRERQRADVAADKSRIAVVTRAGECREDPRKR